MEPKYSAEWTRFNKNLNQSRIKQTPSEKVMLQDDQKKKNIQGFTKSSLVLVSTGQSKDTIPQRKLGWAKKNMDT